MWLPIAKSLAVPNRPNARSSAAGAAPPLTSDRATELHTTAIPPSALGRDRARCLTARFHHPPHQTVQAAFTAHGFPGVNLPSSSLLYCPCHQGPVHRLPLTVRTVFTALLRIMSTTER